jgi:hypothetical protein
MAMTKKEQAMVEELKERLQIAAAFHRTTAVLPDVPIPSGWNELSKGWHPWAAGSDPRVEVACSSSIHHATGRTDKTTSQLPLQLHSTRLRALRALRFEMEEDFAYRLSKVDEQIEKEIENPTQLS